jgi:hypothetical protein
MAAPSALHPLAFFARVLAQTSDAMRREYAMGCLKIEMSDVSIERAA